MSLRPNVFGWSFQGLKQVLRSKDAEVLRQASLMITAARLETLDQQRALTWLRTLIDDGLSLRSERPRPSLGDDGGLLTVQVETEFHALVVISLVQTIAHKQELNWTEDSSDWKHEGISAVWNEATACRFTGSDKCALHFFKGMAALSRGTPLFGDDLRSDWSLYTYMLHADLAGFIAGLRAVESFERRLPTDIPEKYRKELPTSLSDNAKLFVHKLSEWFSRIEQAGQDFFVMWT
jgi:hypothetical protein